MNFHENELDYTLGLIGGLLIIISDFSQIFKNIRKTDVSKHSFLQIAAKIGIAVIFLSYGIHLNLMVHIVLYSFYLLCIIGMLYWWRFHKNKTFTPKVDFNNKKYPNRAEV